MIRQAKVFTSEEQLNTWLKENKEKQIISIQFELNSVNVPHFFVQYNMKDESKEHTIGFQS